MADLKSSEAAFQLSLVLSNPFPLVIPIWAFFSCNLFCFTKAAWIKWKITCSCEVNLLASELNSFLFDMKTNLQALACFSKALRLNFLPHPYGHSTNSFSFSCKSFDSSTSSYFITLGSLGFTAITCYSIGFTGAFCLGSYFFTYFGIYLTYGFGSYFSYFFWIKTLFWGACGIGLTYIFFFSNCGESLRTSFNYPVGGSLSFILGFLYI